MGYVLEPNKRIQREVRGVATERLDDAIGRLDQLLAPDPSDPVVDLETVVHEVRKRCKACRGLARLVKPALGDGFGSFDRTIRDAANQLSTLRDAHALLDTFDALLTHQPDDKVLRTMRERHRSLSAGASQAAVAADDRRVETARALLAEAREAARHWRLPPGFDTIEAGMATTYRQGRSTLRRVRADPTDHRLHDWRKAVKYLWYQVQLVRLAAPSVLEPLIQQLDLLAETLGDDHDLTVLLQWLDERPDDYGTPSDVEHVRQLVRHRQHELRQYALRSGTTVFAEPDHAFVHRIARYWQLTIDNGPEPREQPGAHDVPARSVVERERKFLVDEVPEDLVRSDVAELRQGYLAADERRSVRVRDAGPAGCTLTVKAGVGAERTEIERPIDREEFEAAWPHTEAQRIQKSRHRVPFGEHVIELDVFGGALDGLVMAEVEFTSVNAMTAFVPPAWFGREVTDDGGYTNASLALHGLPARHAGDWPPPDTFA